MACETLTYDAAWAVGGADAGGADPLALFLDRYGPGLLKVAAGLIRRLRIDESDLDAPAAVDIACFQLGRARERGELPAVVDDESLLRMVCVFLKRATLKERNRSRALKRGGAGELDSRPRGEPESESAHAGFHRVELEPDALYSRDSSLEESAIVHDELDALLAHLKSRRARAVLKLRFGGWMVDEIAAQLAISPRSVRYHLSRIRTAFEARHGRL